MNLIRSAFRPYGLGWALLGFLITRVVVIIAAYTAPQDRTRADSPNWWDSNPLIRWDCGHYGHICAYGYPMGGPKIPDTVAFFPAFPLVCRLFLRWLSTEHSLLLVGHATAVLGMVVAYFWCRKRSDDHSAFWCVMLISTYPPAMFFSTGYSEGFFFLCAVLIIWMLDAGWIWRAACVSAVATATRPTGVALAVVVIVWAYLRGPRRPAGGRALYLMAVGGLSVAGLAAYQLYLWHHYGRPDAFFLAQYNWADKDPPSDPWMRILTLKPVLQPAGRLLLFPFRGQFDQLLIPARWNPFFNLGILVLAFIGLLRSRTIPRPLFLIPIIIFLMGYLLDPFRGGRLLGIARYQLVAIPCFLLLAGWPWLRRVPLLMPVLLLTAMALQCVYMRGYVNWELVG